MTSAHMNLPTWTLSVSNAGSALCQGMVQGAVQKLARCLNARVWVLYTRGVGLPSTPDLLTALPQHPLSRPVPPFLGAGCLRPGTCVLYDGLPLAFRNRDIALSTLIPVVGFLKPWGSWDRGDPSLFNLVGKWICSYPDALSPVQLGFVL